MKALNKMKDNVDNGKKKKKLSGDREANDFFLAHFQLLTFYFLPHKNFGELGCEPQGTAPKAHGFTDLW